ncbi:hypothetical protein WA026_000573 [Henosepilachna vigintioctopunctata]|uniref:C2H2-type domain-containing protein n=1 Tax=Henosepilachna vigintioctopunctata TaxID=420089 RepID=A0AAW1UY20_9CUCU
MADNPNAPIVGYSEVLTPKCSLKLIKNEYTEQANSIDSTGKTALSTFFNSVEEKLLSGEYKHGIETLPNIMYSCFFCKKEYGGIFAQNAILNHIHNDHCMEHALMCCECKKQYNALMLIKNRWFHRCESNPTAKNPMADIVIN